MLLLQRDNIGAVRCLARGHCASLLIRNDAGLTALDMAQASSPREPAVVTLLARLEREEREKEKRDKDHEANARAEHNNGGGAWERGQWDWWERRQWRQWRQLAIK